jgi:NAD(P)-dependent dehydrogenase (short-subunit alcohol dehydrogenase family)
LRPMDVADGEARDRLASSLQEKFGKLDVLIHSAALMGSVTPVAQADPAEWERVYAVNVTGTFRMIRALEPLMLAAPAARAIFMSSGATNHDAPTWSQYSSSKSAMESLVRAWADEMRKTPVRAVILEPTSMRTDMRAVAVPNEDRSLLNDPAELGPLIIQLLLMDPGRPRPNVVFAAWKKAGKPALN